MDDAGSALPASASTSYDAATAQLLAHGYWARAEPDYSSFLVLHEAYARGGEAPLPLFTFGPLGFLYQGYHPRTFGAQLLLWTILAGAVAVTLSFIAASSSKGWGHAALWSMACVLLIAVSPREAVVLLLPLLHSVISSVTWEKRPFLIEVVAGSAAAAAGLIKLSALALGVAIALATLGHDLVRKRVPWGTLAYGATLVLLWPFTRRPFSEWKTFFVGAAELLPGYTDASSLAGIGSAQSLISVLAVGLAILLIVGVLAWREGRAQAVFPVMAVAMTVLSAVKAGFVRSDPYHLPTAVVTVAVAAVVLTAVWTRKLRRPATWIWTSAAAGLFLVLPWIGSVGALVPQLQAAVRIADVARASDRRHEEEMTLIRQRTAIRVEGPVDIYPHRQSIVLAHGLRYEPRPVLQSYIAWSGRLARRNAEFLRGAKAPRTLLFEVRPVDGRLSSIEDGASWPEILSRYAYAGRSGSVLLLAMRDRPQSLRLEPRGLIRARFGERVVVPPHHAMVWATIRPRSTVIGSLASLAFRTPILYVTLEFADGSTRKQRLVPGSAANGFLLSPHVIDSSAFAALLRGDPALFREYAVRSIRITSESGNPSMFHREPIEVTFHDLVIEGFPQAKLSWRER